MKADWYFEKFELIADAPAAVSKMRELVLTLAMQGWLIDQKHDDGNAIQLLTAIYRERDSRTTKLRTHEQLTSADGNEHIFPIPSNWSWTQLGNIALQIQYGYTASADPSATEIRMLRITDIQNNRVDWPSVPGCQIESDEAEKYLLRPNDILIARTGGTIGKSFIVPDAPVKSVFASYLIRVTPPRAMAARYLKTFLESPLYWTQLRQMSAGTGQPNVNGQSLGRLAVPLPPLAEQKRIVAKVDELMALCDQLEAQQQERETRKSVLVRASLARFAEAPTPVNLGFLFHKSYDIPPAELRKTILTLAVQGKLVPQHRNDIPVNVGNHLIENHLFAVPMNWQWTRLADIYDVAAGITKSPIRMPRVNEFPYLRVANVQRGRLELDRVERFELFEGELERWRLEPGDLLIVEGNGSETEIGRCAMWNGEIPNCVHQNHIIRCRTSLGVQAFTLLFINSPSGMAEMRRLAITTSGLYSLSVGKIRSLPMPLPPLTEQRRIVAKVDQLMALVDELERQQESSHTKASELLDAIVHELTDRPMLRDGCLRHFGPED